MEENLEKLYQDYMESRKKVMRELIEFSNNYDVKRGLGNIQATVEGLMDDFGGEENPLVRAKLSERVVDNTKFLLEATGTISQNQPMINQALPNPVQESNDIGMIEAITFEED